MRGEEGRVTEGGWAAGEEGRRTEGEREESQGETCKSTSRLKRAEVIARVLRRTDPRYHRLISLHLVAAEDFALAHPRISKEHTRPLLSNYIVTELPSLHPTHRHL